MQCPWSGFDRGSTTFCEATLCSWVESPGIAWVSILYVLVGLFLFRLVDKKDHWLLQLFPWFALSMGASSFLYHASHLFIFQVWDVASMFFLGTAIILLNLRRMLLPSTPILFWSLVTLETFLFLFFKAWSAPAILGTLIACFLFTEYYLLESRAHWKDFQLTIGLFLLALGALWMEYKSGLCDPHNHIFQWHAVWNGLCALTYLTLFRHFKKVY